MSRPTIGIITLYLSNRCNLEERNYFRKVIVQGRKMGLNVIAFTPQDVDEKNKRVHAHLYDPAQSRWRRKWTPFPQIIYDRCRYRPTERFRQFQRFRAAHSNLIFMNQPISNKWGVYQLLSKHADIRPHVPATIVYRTFADLQQFLKKRSLVYLKPINGTGGRGILRIERRPKGMVLIQGRDHRRRIIAPRLLAERQIPIQFAFLGLKDHYLIQQGVQSKLPDGRVHDFRLLIQKNGNGEWEVTGCAGRIGAARSITSNLHGGGKAVPMIELLKQRFASDEKVEAIRTSVYDLGYSVAKCVEQEYGMLCELGIDIAVDADGHPWLLELNPKPAREVFARIGELETYRKAITRPLEYALWLYKRKIETATAAQR